MSGFNARTVHKSSANGCFYYRTGQTPLLLTVLVTLSESYVSLTKVQGFSRFLTFLNWALALGAFSSFKAGRRTGLASDGITTACPRPRR